MISTCCILERAAMENEMFTFTTSQREAKLNQLSRSGIGNNMGMHFEGSCKRFCICYDGLKNMRIENTNFLSAFKGSFFVLFCFQHTVILVGFTSGKPGYL